jgi:hypothetical protein
MRPNHKRPAIVAGRIINEGRHAMSEKYIITLECNKSALAELIATGLERHATITKVEAAQEQASVKLAAVAGSKPAPEPVLRGAFYPGPEKKPKWKKSVTCWQVYQAAVDSYHPQKSFKSSELTEECRRQGLTLSSSSAAAHLFRLHEAGLVRRVGGDQVLGYVYTIARVVGRKELERAMKNGR